MAHASASPQEQPEGELWRGGRGSVAAGGKVTAYVCENGLCRLPAIAPEKLASQIAPVRPYG